MEHQDCSLKGHLLLKKEESVFASHQTEEGEEECQAPCLKRWASPPLLPLLLSLRFLTMFGENAIMSPLTHTLCLQGVLASLLHRLAHVSQLFWVWLLRHRLQRVSLHEDVQGPLPATHGVWPGQLQDPLQWRLCLHSQGKYAVSTAPLAMLFNRILEPFQAKF